MPNNALIIHIQSHGTFFIIVREYYINIRLAFLSRAYIIRYMAKYRNRIQHVVSAFKALSDENRLRALFAICDQELCVCQIIELLNLAPSTVSKHIPILKQAGLVESEKRGRWVYYRLAGNHSNSEARQVIDWVIEACENEGIILGLHVDETINTDKKRLKQILQMEPEELCKKQMC